MGNEGEGDLRKISEKKEKKNIRKTIKLIDSNLYATKENLRHQKKNARKLALRKFFGAAKRKPSNRGESIV